MGTKCSTGKGTEVGVGERRPGREKESGCKRQESWIQ